MKIRTDFKQNKPFGRFGGGWNWKVGLQIGGRTMIISLLIGEVIITFRK